MELRDPRKCSESDRIAAGWAGEEVDGSAMVEPADCHLSS